MKNKITYIVIVMMMAIVVSQDSLGYRFSKDASVRVFHASPDAPSVDILVDGGLAFQDVEYREVTDYAVLPKGGYNVQVVPTGATEPVVIDADLYLRRFRSYTVMAVDTLDSIEPLVIKDRKNVLSNKVALVRFVHASPDAPAVDIAVKDGPVLFSNVEFKEYSGYIRVKPGEYDLEVRLAGTDTVVLSLDNIDFNKKMAYTAVAVGQVGKGTLGAELLVDN